MYLSGGVAYFLGYNRSASSPIPTQLGYSGSGTGVYVGTTGNVGIGTTSPGEALDVRANSGAQIEFAMVGTTQVGFVGTDANGFTRILGYNGVGIGYGQPGAMNEVARAVSTGFNVGAFLNVATSGQNFNSPQFSITGDFYNGSGAVTDNYIFQDVVGTGTNPTGNLQIARNGSAGASYVSFTNSSVGINTNLPLDALTVFGSGNATKGFVRTVSAFSGPFFYGEELGTSYGSGLPIYAAVSDGTITTNNYFMVGTANSTTTYSLRGDGQAYFAGQVGVGNSSPGALLNVGSSGTSAGVVAIMQNTTGSCSFTPLSSGSGTWTCSSDERLKKDIVDTQSAMPWIMDMRVRDFTMKSDGTRLTGVIAQEMQVKHPEMVHMGNEGYLGVDAPNQWKVIKAIQELKVANDNAQKQIATLVDTSVTKVKAWLGDAHNGLNDIYASIVHAHEVHSDKMCLSKKDGTEVCVTGDQLQDMIDDESRRRHSELQKTGTQ
jgi:hypothetical protein